MDESKVSAIREWPIPKTMKELQSFLGLANFYRRFIEGYSRITALLIDLTKKAESFSWGTATQSAFDTLKKRFMEAPILATFDPERQIVLEIDVSDYTIGIYISQPDENERLRPVAFYSKKMIPAEINYEIHDKELLAIVTVSSEWRVYLEGSKYPVKVFTDHKNLLYFTTTKVLNRRQVRWAELLLAYNFTISYTKGHENAKADALSRRPDHAKDTKEASQAVLRQNEDGTISYNYQTLAATFRIKDTEQERRIIRAYAKDQLARNVKKTPDKFTSFEVLDNGIILYKGLIYVPYKLANKIIRIYHEETT